MKAVHSFWSKAYFEGRWGEESKIEHDIYNFALSCHFARKTFKNIDLVTDEIGASLLEGLPYSNIGTDLEDLSQHRRKILDSRKSTHYEGTGGTFHTLGRRRFLS